MITDSTMPDEEKISTFCGLAIHEAAHLKFTEYRVINSIESILADSKKKYSSKEINFMKTFRLPEAKRSDVFRIVSDDRHIIGNGQNIAGFHGNNNRFIRTTDGPWIPETGPVIRFFHLATINKTLLKKSIAETETVSGQRHITGDGAVKETGGKPSETAVAERIVFNIFHNGNIDTFFLQQIPDFFQ